MSKNIPLCPTHKVPMVLRIARKGKFAGKRFFGCPKFPKCREIIDHDPDLHGEIENDSASTERSTSQSGHVILEFPSIPQRVALQAPVHLDSRSRVEGLQCAFFENASMPYQLISSIYRGSMEPSILRSLSQWRLDYPLPKRVIDSDVYRSVLAVVEKILLRGSRTPCSPHVQAFLDENLNDNEWEQGDWIKAAQAIANIGCGIGSHQWFDSAEEELFYKKVLPSCAGTTNIYTWTVPQVSLASLIPGMVELGVNQRVDFLIAHPGGLNIVVEIDGAQHLESIEADQRRDDALATRGFQIIRIPVNEVRKGEGPNLDRLKQQLNSLEAHVFSNAMDSVSKSILLSRVAGQIQVSLLQAIKGGFLSLEEKCHWLIAGNSPPWCTDQNLWEGIVESAVDDFIGLLEAITKLYIGNTLDLHFSYSPDINSKSKNTSPDIHLFFDDNEITETNAGDFHIAELFVPNPIAQSLPVASPVKNILPDYDTVEYLLYYIFRKETFMDGQWDTIQRTLEGNDSIVLLPTGGGKSIAFQLASLLLPGPCLVIDPLIALITDQIDNLCSSGIDRVAGVTSQLSQKEKLDVLAAFSQGHYIFCYVAPERLQMEGFREALRAVTTISPISVVAIDEVHCISEWGHDFRTSYLNVGRNARKFCEYQGHIPPLLGLTGTASRSVLKDVQRELDIEDFDAIITPKSFDRPELNFQVMHCSSSEKHARLRGFLASLPGRFGVSPNIFFQPRGSKSMAGLVFFPHVNGEFGVSTGYQELRQVVMDSGLYSGKAPKGIADDQWDDIKSAFAEKFKHDDLTLLVCTNAFGMGIDKPNIRYTVHVNLPRSIEAFYQEAGRAGRDREKSECLLIVSNDNPARTSRLLDPTTPLREVTQITNDVAWGEQDDIVRMMYFHVSAFKGAQEEVRSVTQLMTELGDLTKMRTETITYTKDTRNVREKAVHRLVILAVIDDYTTDYAHEEINLRLSGADKETILAAYVKYVSAYNRRRAQNLEEIARGQFNLSHREFLDFIILKLTEFIYNTVELGRRRSLAEMLQASMSGNADEDIRRHILNYLELGQYSELLDVMMEQAEDLPQLFEELLEQITSPNDAAELRGQTARLLESYPDNPALLFVRAVAELMCRDRDEQVLVVNLNAAIRYALLETGWALSTVEITPVVILFAELACSIDLELAHLIVRTFLDDIDNPRMGARKIVEQCSLEASIPAVQYLLGSVSEKLVAVLQD